jgi:hypothetical protein
MRERIGAFNILAGRPNGKRLLRRPKRMWKDNIKTGVYEVRWGSNNWIDLAQDRDT